MISGVFFAAAALAICCALVVITHRRPIVSLLALVVMLFAVAMIFAIIGMDFLAAIQVIVYSGAVMVLFLFAIMMLNMKDTEGLREGGAAQAVLTVPAAIGIGGGLVYAALHLAPNTGAVIPGAERGTAYLIGRALTGSHLFAFEFISVVLVAAIVAAVYLARTPR